MNINNLHANIAAFLRVLKADSTAFEAVLARLID
jgi:hypothetical protein